MFKDFIHELKPTKHTLSFFLSFISVIGFFSLAYFKNTDITTVIPMILGIYVGARATEKSVSIYAASKDPNTSTRDVINDLNGIKMPKVDNPD